VGRIDEFGRMQRCVIGFLLGDYALQGVTEWEISEERKTFAVSEDGGVELSGLGVALKEDAEEL
jgi:hypothetical protein